MCAKNYENWMTVDKVIAKIIWPRFFGPPLDIAGTATVSTCRSPFQFNKTIGLSYSVCLFSEIFGRLRHIGKQTYAVA